MGLVQPPQLAGQEVGDWEASTRAGGCFLHTALPALQDLNPVPCGGHTHASTRYSARHASPPDTVNPPSSQLLTSDSLIETPLAPRSFLLFLSLMLLRPLAASAAALHLSQAFLQGLLQPGQCQSCLLAPQELQA